MAKRSAVSVAVPRLTATARIIRPAAKSNQEVHHAPSHFCEGFADPHSHHANVVDGRLDQTKVGLTAFQIKTCHQEEDVEKSHVASALTDLSLDVSAQISVSRDSLTSCRTEPGKELSSRVFPLFSWSEIKRLHLCMF